MPIPAPAEEEAVIVWEFAKAEMARGFFFMVGMELALMLSVPVGMIILYCIDEFGRARFERNKYWKERRKREAEMQAREG